MTTKWNYVQIYRDNGEEWCVDVTVTLLVSLSRSDTFVQALNRLGGDGWELVDVEAVDGQSHPWCGYLRRPQGQTPINGHSSPLITEWLHVSVQGGGGEEWQVDTTTYVDTSGNSVANPTPSKNLTFVAVLNEFGDHSWELVKVQYLGGSKWCAFFKRPRQPE